MQQESQVLASPAGGLQNTADLAEDVIADAADRNLRIRHISLPEISPKCLICAAGERERDLLQGEVISLQGLDHGGDVLISRRSRCLKT